MEVEQDTANIEIGESGIVTEDPSEQLIDHKKDLTTPRGIELPLAQPEAQGKNDVAAVNGENGECADKIDWAVAVMNTENLKSSYKEETRGYKSVNPEKHSTSTMVECPKGVNTIEFDLARWPKVSLEMVEWHKVSSKVEDNTKLAVNKNGCQVNEELAEGLEERDKITHQGITIERDLEISPTFPSKQPYTNPMPLRFSFKGAEPNADGP